MSSFFMRVEDFFDSLTDRFRNDFEENRREERRTERAAADLLTTENEVATENEVGGGGGESGGGLMKVVTVDFRARSNAALHNCEKYELVNLQSNTPVIRRGGNFVLDLEFSSPVDLKKGHQVKLYFNFGNAPNSPKGTQAILTVSGKAMFDKNHQHWDVRVQNQAGKTITLEVQVPSDCPVGVWRPAVEVTKRDPSSPTSPPRYLLRLDTMLYILFNPWNKNDATYLPEEDRRQEYVLNDVGKIWQGSYPTARGRHWVFGQFDDAVLPACIILMERSGLRHEARGDPIQVSRAVSRIVNANNDRGVVVGRWDGKYGDGTSPSSWTGSIKILEQFVRTNSPVRYGQCWVFAGVLNTVCRALGLPARVVSNFNSAHDTDVSLTIDEYFDKEGNEIESYRHDENNPGGLRDSIWNFHVWNDVWMTRPDLPSGYGGWQAIDSTPQEVSEGVFQCGPASLEAVRRGQMELKYDVPFVLAEVNADIVRWKEDKDAQDGFKKLYSNKTHVGRQLLTKKVGVLEDSGFVEEDKEDVTTDYKPPEGTRAERVTLYTAARRSRAARHAFRFPSEAIEDVEFSIEDLERVPIGQDFAITVKANNTSEKIRTISIILRASSIYYTGSPAHQITSAEGKFVLQPSEVKTLSLPVPYTKYYHRLVEHALIKMVVHCNVEETSYAWVDDDCFEVLKPDVKVEVLTSGTLQMGSNFTAKFSFTNPLHVALEDCILVVDGPGLLRPKTIPISDVAADNVMAYELRITPKKPGVHTLVATFNSTQLLNLSGSTRVTVEA